VISCCFCRSRSLSVPVLALVKAFDDFQAMMISAARLSALAQAPCETFRRCAGYAPHAGTAGGRRPDVFLSWRAARVLSDLSCVFEAGEKVALVGRAGS